MQNSLIKKNLISLFVLSIALSICGCAPKNPEGAQEPNALLTIALRKNIYGSVIKNCLINFEQQFGVKCSVEELAEEELHTRIANDAKNEQGAYDLCMIDGSWMAEYTADGVLSPLDELGYALDGDIIPMTTTICYDKGHLYLAPYGGNVTVLLYNRLMVKEAGYEPEDLESLDVLLDICRFQKRRHNLGFMYRGDSENNIVVDFLPILRTYGGWVVNDDNRPTVDTPEFREALEAYLELISTGRAAKQEDLIAAIANKAAVMGIGWPGWYTPARNSSMDYLMMSGKVTKDSTAYNANVYGVWTIGIPANSQNKDYSIKLLEYLMDPDVQKTTIQIGGVPCRYSSLQDEEVLKKFPYYDVICKALEGGIYRPVMRKWPQFYTILGKQMEAIIDGSKSVDDALKDAQRELEELIR